MKSNKFFLTFWSVVLFSTIAVSQVQPSKVNLKDKTKSQKSLPAKKVKSSTSSPIVETSAPLVTPEKQIFLNFDNGSSEGAVKDVTNRKGPLAQSEIDRKKAELSLQKSREEQITNVAPVIPPSSIVAEKEPVLLPLLSNSTEASNSSLLNDSKDGVLSLKVEPKPDVHVEVVQAQNEEQDTQSFYASDIRPFLTLDLGYLSYSQQAQVSDRSFQSSSPIYSFNLSLKNTVSDHELASLQLIETLGLNVQTQVENSRPASGKIQNVRLAFSVPQFRRFSIVYNKDELKINGESLSYSGFSSSSLGIGFFVIESKVEGWLIEYFPRLWVKEKVALEESESGANVRAQKMRISYFKQFSGSESSKNSHIKLMASSDSLRFESKDEVSNSGKLQTGVSVGFLCGFVF